MVRRKGWDNLSPAMQLRYARAGVTPQQYQSGAPLAKARGHKSEREETVVRRLRRQWREYNFSTPSLPAFVAHYGAADAELISEQKLAAAEHDPTAVQFMRALWNTKPESAPKEWYWYHSTPR